MRTFLFVLIGYLSGSILFTKVYARWFHSADVTRQADDHNPGVFNAFKYGNAKEGLFTLFGDFFKAFLPVFFYVHPLITNAANAAFADSVLSNSLSLGLVMAAPVFGHAFSMFNHFKGGKGITASFGSFAGLLPFFGPVLSFALLFILFEVILHIRPNYYSTFFTCIGLFFCSFLIPADRFAGLGMVFVSLIIFVKLITSHEHKGKLEVFQWKH